MAIRLDAPPSPPLLPLIFSYELKEKKKEKKRGIKVRKKKGSSKHVARYGSQHGRVEISNFNLVHSVAGTKLKLTLNSVTN